MSRRRAVLSEPSTICMCARTLRWLRPSSKRPHRLVPEEQAPPQSTALASAQHLPQEFRKEKKPLLFQKSVETHRKTAGPCLNSFKQMRSLKTWLSLRVMPQVAGDFVHFERGEKN